MSEQYGNASNASTVDKYECPICGAQPGIPCLVKDGRGMEMVRSLGVLPIDLVDAEYPLMK